MPAHHRVAARAVAARQRGLRRLLACVLGVLAVAVTGCTVGQSDASPGQSAPVGSSSAGGVEHTPSRLGSPSAPSPTRSAWAAWPPTAAPGQSGHLAAGSDPRVLPGPLLIADKANNRLLVVDPQGRIVWQWPSPGDLVPGQTFLIPDDAFFTPDGKNIIATQEDNFVITEINIATGKIVWRYGHPGVHGAGLGYLWNPDDAMLLPDGRVIAADIKNCRLIELMPGAPAPLWAGGVGACRHDPPNTFGSPNGVFPLPDGHFLVTEINGDWVDEIDLAGHVLWSTHPPRVAYPSDSNEYKPGQYLAVGYTNPGQVVIFDSTGRTLWRWDPTTGSGRLNHPSLAMALPNGDIVLNDDRNHRVIVIDPTTNTIVWQYGHTGVAGSAAGYLNIPDGLDLVPPFSYADAISVAGGATPSG